MLSCSVGIECMIVGFCLVYFRDLFRLMLFNLWFLRFIVSYVCNCKLVRLRLFFSVVNVK